MEIKIRPIQPKDDHELGHLIQKVLEGEGAPKTGTAYADETLFELSQFYRPLKREYFVAERDHSLLGGAGIAPVNKLSAICELQKMYVLKEVRKKGVATRLMDACLDFARRNNFESCYLETLPEMKAAQQLYRKYGFDNIDVRLGETGHFSCDVWMLKQL